MISFVLLIIKLINFLDPCLSYSSPSKELPFNPLVKANDNITFSAPLIHRSSPISPFFSPNYTRENHIEDGVINSQARSQYFSQIKAVDNGYVAAPLSGWNMLMKYTMGTPPVAMYGVFDTGSSFSWVQCLPCKRCYKQSRSYPIFNPNHSSSYHAVICHEPYCSIAPGSSCRSNDTADLCLYNTSYPDNWTSRGILSTETLTLSAENTSRTVQHVIFGCGNDNHDRSKSPGIVGVGNSSASLIRQLSISHFSHYFFANSSHIEGMAHFGPGASMSEIGMTTPLLPSDHGVYYLNLIGITVDEMNLDLPPGIFERSIDDNNGTASGFIIDSGTTYTTLQAEAFDTLVSALMHAMHKQIPESTKHFELCYKDVREAPEVVFQFSGLDYILCDANLWVRHKGLYCLAMIRLKESQGNLSILGFHQQRNVQVGYDLINNLLSLMYPEACPPNVADFLEM